MCRLGLGVLAPWDIVKWKSHFLLLGGLFFNVSSFLWFIFFSCRDWVYGFCLVLMFQVEFMVTLRLKKIKIPFLSFWWCHQMLCYFFQIVLIFRQTFNVFEMQGQFRLFETDVDVFHNEWRPWTLKYVTMQYPRVTTHVAIF